MTNVCRVLVLLFSMATVFATASCESYCDACSRAAADAAYDGGAAE